MNSTINKHPLSPFAVPALWISLVVSGCGDMAPENFDDEEVPEDASQGVALVLDTPDGTVRAGDYVELDATDNDRPTGHYLAIESTLFDELGIDETITLAMKDRTVALDPSSELVSIEVDPMNVDDQILVTDAMGTEIGVLRLHDSFSSDEETLYGCSRVTRVQHWWSPSRQCLVRSTCHNTRCPTYRTHRCYKKCSLIR